MLQNFLYIGYHLWRVSFTYSFPNWVLFFLWLMTGWNFQCNVEWWWWKWVSFLDCGGKLLVFTTVKLAVCCPKCPVTLRKLFSVLCSAYACWLFQVFWVLPPLHHGVQSLLDAVVFSLPVLIEASSPTLLRCWPVVLFWWCLGFGVRVTQASDGLVLPVPASFIFLQEIEDWY